MLINNRKKIKAYFNLKKIKIKISPPSTEEIDKDIVTFNLKDRKDFNLQKISTISDTSNTYNMTANDLTYTSGNVIGYSGWTERGLQLSSNNTISMPYINSTAIEINLNTLTWSLRNKLFVIGIKCEDNSEYIMAAHHWGYLASNIYSINDENTSIGGGNLFPTGKITDNDDNFHSIVLLFKNNTITCFIDGVRGNTLNNTVLNNVVGLKLYNSSTVSTTSPYESIKFYNKELTDEEISSNYNEYIARLNKTGYEDLPINTNNNFNTVLDMINANLAENSIVTTNGYNTVGDNGAAKYKIVSYNTFYDELPSDCKYVTINGNVKTPVDNFGNHNMKNGLVAKIISDTNTYTPEQWGAKGDGITSDTEAFICMLALVKTGTINFKDGAIYMIASRSDDECSQYVDNRFVVSMMKVFTGGCHRPLIANCENLILNGNPSGDGNKATMRIPDNDFGFGMGMLCLGRTIKGLEIKNIIFDSNGLTMLDTSIRGVANKTSNHTIVYAPGTADDSTQSILNNLNIHHCKFLDNGTMINTQDGGGDHILIINPTASENVWIEDNEFYNWGRWVYSVDLGGSGERFYNYKFNRNICKQDDTNYIGEHIYRGLGWIDYEAKKCWTGLEVSGNTVEGLVGFAMNGNGRVLENFTFNDNNILFIDRSYRSAYPYFLNFYSVRTAKNSIIENNILHEPYSVSSSAYCMDGLSFKNNQLYDGAVLAIPGIYGDIIIDNNTSGDPGQRIVTISNRAQAPDDYYLMAFPDYINPDESRDPCNFTFTNNTGGIIANGMLMNGGHPGLFDHLNITIKGNTLNDLAISAMESPFEFSLEENTVPAGKDANLILRGATFKTPTFFNPVNTPIKGAPIYREGDLIAENVNMSRMDRPSGGGFIPNFYYDIIPGKTYNIYCSKTGYFPLPYQDKALLNNIAIKYGTFYYTEDNLYISQNDGVTSPAEGDLPSHTSGVAAWGDVQLLWVASIGRIRLEEVVV